MKSPAPIPRFASSIENQASKSEHLGSKPFEVNECTSNENGDKNYLILPSQINPASVTVMHRARALEHFPRLNEFQQQLIETYPDEEFKQLHAVFCVSQEELLQDGSHSQSGLLVANVPDYLSPMLDKLFGSPPEVANIVRLNRITCSTVLMWSVQDERGILHSVAISAALLSQRPIKGAKPRPSRIVFCCADLVAVGSYVIDNDAIHEAQTEAMLNRYYRNSPKEELARADADAVSAGSDEPWLGKPWKTNDRGFLTQIAHAELGVARLSQRATGYAQEYFIKDEYGYRAEDYFRPQKPALEVKIIERSNATQFLPNFDELQLRLANSCMLSGTTAKASALFVMDDSAGDYETPLTVDPLLIANLPDYLAPLIEKLASTAPVPVNLPWLDLKDNETLMMWRVRDHENRLHIVAIDFGMVPLLTSRISAHGELHVARIALCCANQVAFSSLWIDNTDYLEAYGAQENGSQYGCYDELEKAGAALRASKAGSARPWYGKPWCDENGTTLTQLVLFTSDLSGERFDNND
ncbi:hypothetical protein NHH73_22770 [Oxalobacteraceae bacterium OTU3CINTB1]|nr:hypothetical protein NHH73_22770 [Oxalobacteraceae bacterium OTU3CINTB1]